MVGYPMATKSPILVFFCGMDHQNPKFSLISVPFLSEAVEVSRYHFFENWLMKHKYPNLRISKPPSNKFYLAFFYLSESIHKICFNVTYPVVRKLICEDRILLVVWKKFGTIICFCLSQCQCEWTAISTISKSTVLLTLRKTKSVTKQLTWPYVSLLRWQMRRE